MADNGDRMFCHACGGVWLRNDSGLTCPHCESDFTEIIEIPPENPPPERADEPRTPPNMNPWADHDPWAREGTPDSPGFGFMGRGSPGFAQRTYRSPDGRFTFSSTTFGGGYSPRQEAAHADPTVPMMVQSLDTLFNGLADTYRPHGPPEVGPTTYRPPPPPGWQDHDPFVADELPGPGRLHPRNAGGPQARAPPVENLAELMDAFRADYGPRPRGGRPGARTMTGPNPLSILSALLNLDRTGDAVYSQEELDRVISQLIDQNAHGGAPPPAAGTAIRSLPKKKVDQEMLGTDVKAECSICMDAVELGTEVTVLPCTHWFHYNCIEAWLSQHNTCPHCRRSINSTGGAGEGTRESPVVIQDSPDRRTSTGQGPSSGLTPRSGRSSSSGTRSSPSQSRESRGSRDSGSRRASRGEGHHGGFTNWVWSRLGGGG